MNELLQLQQKISKYAAAFSGVFTLSDLKNLIAAKNSVHFYRQLKRLEDSQILFSFVRGIYVTPQFKLDVVSQKLCAQSYISLASVLAQNLMIGTVPRNTVYAVKLGKSRTYESRFGTIVHLGLTPKLFFGFHKIQGVNWAEPEKAFLDTLYFYQKGFKLYFNIYDDLNATDLNRKKIMTYLKNYKNPRFKKFVERKLHG